MVDLKTILSIRNQKAIETISSNELDEALLYQYTTELGYRLFYINGFEIKTKDDLFAHLAKIMQFPEYFGYNWDALDECINDLEWLPLVNGFVLLFSHPEGLINNNFLDFKKFLDSVLFAFDYWKSQNTRFLLILESEKKINLTNIGLDVS